MLGAMVSLWDLGIAVFALVALSVVFSSLALPRFLTMVALGSCPGFLDFEWEMEIGDS